MLFFKKMGRSLRSYHSKLEMHNKRGRFIPFVTITTGIVLVVFFVQVYLSSPAKIKPTTEFIQGL
jgi:hypothetical protein